MNIIISKTNTGIFRINGKALKSESITNMPSKWYCSSYVKYTFK